MNIVIGLGNPGATYKNNRHNIGFTVLDELANREALRFVEKPIFHAFITEFGKLVLAKPTTFMNESGQAAKALLKHYEVPLVVVYDDITIALGEVKCSFGRGDGGHNGLTSIINHIDTKEFFRIRIGIRPVHEELLPRIAPPDGFEKFMLTNFTEMEQEKLQEAITKSIAIIEALPHKSFEEIMNQFN